MYPCPYTMSRKDVSCPFLISNHLCENFEKFTNRREAWCCKGKELDTLTNISGILYIDKDYSYNEPISSGSYDVHSNENLPMTPALTFYDSPPKEKKPTVLGTIFNFFRYKKYRDL